MHSTCSLPCWQALSYVVPSSIHTDPTLRSHSNKVLCWCFILLSIQSHIGACARLIIPRKMPGTHTVHQGLGQCRPWYSYTTGWSHTDHAVGQCGFSRGCRRHDQVWCTWIITHMNEAWSCLLTWPDDGEAEMPTFMHCVWKSRIHRTHTHYNKPHTLVTCLGLICGWSWKHDTYNSATIWVFITKFQGARITTTTTTTKDNYHHSFGQ